MKENSIKKIGSNKEKKRHQTGEEHKQNNPFLFGNQASSNPFFDDTQLKANPFAVANQGNPFDVNTIRQPNANQTSTPVIQGKFNYSASSLEAVGLKAGHKVGIGKSSFGKLLIELNNYQQAYQEDNLENQTEILGRVINHCYNWLKSPKRKKNKKGDAEKKILLEKMREDALTEIGKVNNEIKDKEIDKQYVEDMLAGKMKETAKVEQDRQGKDFEKTLVRADNELNHTHSNKLAPKLDGKSTDADVTAYTTANRGKFSQGKKLGRGELAALIRFTGQDYKYMKPAYEGLDSWLEEELQKMGKLNKQTVEKNNMGATITKQGEAIQGEERKALIEAYKSEGKRHSEMAIKALHKLPDHKGIVYRGLGVTPENFEKNYKKGLMIKFVNITSTSILESKADYFMNQNASKGVRVKIEIDCKTGKNVIPISQVFQEAEVIYPPGVSLKIMSTEDKKDGDGSYKLVKVVEV